MHKKNRLLALLMVFVLLFTFVGFTASATAAPAPTRVMEVESLRETNAETYLMSDGSYECVVYAYDKYYKAPDNTLQLTSSKIVPAGAAERSGKLSSGKVQYKNAANAFDVHFAGSGAPEISLAYQGAAVTFSPITSGKNTAGTSFTLGKVTGCKTLDALTFTGDNTVTYNNAFPNTDLVYVLENNTLKEYIILNSTGAGNTFHFQFSLDGVSMQTADNYTEFVDRAGNALFSLDSLFAVDAKGAFTEKLQYTFEPVKGTNNIIVTVTLDKAFLTKAAFPVIIDPTLKISSSETDDACVCSLTPNTNYQTAYQLRTGKDDEYGVRRTFIKFHIPDYITEGSVGAARIEIKKLSGADPTIRAYQCISNWSSSTITWSNMPDDEGNFALDSPVAVPAACGLNWYALNVTEIVCDWVDGFSPNYGFILMDEEEGDMDHWTTWYSSNAEFPYKPELYITYDGSEPEDPDPDAEDHEPDEPDPDPDDPDPHPDPDPEPEPEPDDPNSLVRFYGVTVTDHDHTPSPGYHYTVLQYAESLFDTSNYPDAIRLTGSFYPEAFKQDLSNAAIVTTLGHGYHREYGVYHATGLLLNEKSPSAADWWLLMSTDYRHITNDTYDRFAYISCTDNFSNLKLAVFVGCETAREEDFEDETNFAYRIYNQGAAVSIGFSDEIECADAMDWIEKFYYYLFEGYTIGEAAEKAARAVGPSITTDNCKVYGTTSAKNATLADLFE